jgi:hypothetical protein
VSSPDTGLQGRPPIRYGENPNRLQHYYQFQVLLKPSPNDIQDLYLESLSEIGYLHPFPCQRAAVVCNPLMPKMIVVLRLNFETKSWHLSLVVTWLVDRTLSSSN